MAEIYTGLCSRCTSWPWAHFLCSVPQTPHLTLPPDAAYLYLLLITPQALASASGVLVPRHRLPAPSFPWHPLAVGTELFARLSPAGALPPNCPRLQLCRSRGRSTGIPLPCGLRSGTQDEVNTQAVLGVCSWWHACSVAVLRSPGAGTAKDWELQSKALQTERCGFLF